MAATPPLYFEKRGCSRIFLVLHSHSGENPCRDVIEDVWLNYVKDLYKDETQPSQINQQTRESAPKIKLWELQDAIKRARNHKAAGEDALKIDLIKHITLEYKKNFSTRDISGRGW